MFYSSEVKLAEPADCSLYLPASMCCLVTAVEVRILSGRFVGTGKSAQSAAHGWMILLSVIP